MSEYANRIPLDNPDAFADWLITGLERFNVGWKANQIGTTNAFPGFNFSVRTDIPSQFSDLFSLLDPSERTCVRDGLKSALLRFELTRGYWYGTCLDLIRIAINFHPKLISMSAPAILGMAREAASNASLQTEAEILYANTVSAIAAQKRFDRVALTLIEEELQYAKATFPRVLPLLCITIATCKPRTWSEQLLTAVDSIWPGETPLSDSDNAAFKTMLQNFGAIAKADHVSRQLQQIFLGLQASKQRMAHLLSALFDPDRASLVIVRNSNLEDRNAPYLIGSELLSISHPVKFDRLSSYEKNRLDAILSEFVNNTFEHNIRQIAA